MVKIGSATLTDDQVAYLLREGYTWSEERQCYFMETEKFRHWNNKPVTHTPISTEVDQFHRALHAPYGGDCGRRTSEILTSGN